jgi:hypothetical protein
MKKSLLELYALAVCFFTVACFAIALGIALYAIVGVVDPSVTLDSYAYAQHQSNDSYWQGCAGPYCARDDKRVRPPEAELTKQREDSFARALSNERRNEVQSLIKCFIVILVDLIIFLFHWVLARRARNAA